MKHLFVLSSVALLLSACGGKMTGGVVEDSTDPTTVVIGDPVGDPSPVGSGGSVSVGGSSSAVGGTDSVMDDSPSVTEPQKHKLLPIQENLQIELAKDTPASGVVTPDGDPGGNGFEFSRYIVTNLSDEPVSLVALTIRQVDPNGDMADFHETIFYSTQWEKRFVAINPPKQSESCTLQTPMGSPMGPIVIAPHSSGMVSLYGWMEQPLPMDQADGAWHGVARAGHTPALQLIEAMTSTRMLANILPHVAVRMRLENDP